MALSRQQPAKFLSIPDLLSSDDPSQQGLLRIIGRLESYDIKHSILWLHDHNTPSLQVAVECTNIEPFPFKIGLLYQFIGEVDYRDVPDHGCVPENDTLDFTSDRKRKDATTRCAVMKALLYRCVEGLDMGVYMRAHEARMKDLLSANLTINAATDSD